MRFLVVAIVLGFTTPAVAGKDSDKDVEQARGEAITVLVDEIRAMSDGPKKATKMVQLAELYWERGDAVVGDDVSAAESYKKAVQIYEYVVKKYPQRKSDQAYFYLGANYLRRGDEAKATIVFGKLCDKWPASPFCADAIEKLEALADDAE